jgi:hypothetical protein
MSSKLLIYIGEKTPFDLPTTIKAISTIKGVSCLREGSLIGAVFECSYGALGHQTLVRISPECETIIVEGLGDEAFRFALELQKSTSIPLNAIDMDFTFQLALHNYRSVSEIKSALRFGMARPQQTNGVG